MGRHIKTCTNGRWNYGGLCENGGTIIGPFILREGYLFKDGKTRFQRGDWDGVWLSRDKAKEVGLTHGYTQPYGRNLTGFKQSRAARKRGYRSTDFFYNLNASRWTPEYVAQRKEEIRKLLED